MKPTFEEVSRRVELLAGFHDRCRVNLKAKRWGNIAGEVFIDVSTEMNRGKDKFGEFASAHELYAVLKEEVDEFWDSVKGNDPDPEELLQVAAVAPTDRVPRPSGRSDRPPQKNGPERGLVTG